MTDLSNTPSLISYLEKNFNLENFNSYIQSSKSKLSKYNKSGWLENLIKSFEVYRKQTIESIARGQYLFSPFKLKMIPTKKNKSRRVSVVNINDVFLDRLIFNYINCLSQSQHNNSVHSISLNIKQNIKNGKYYFFRTDIKNFFESLNHSFIFDIIKSYGDKTLTEVINSFLATPWIWVKSEHDIFSVENKNELGVPPGSAISQGLSNIYLYNFDKSILDSTKNNGDVYYRYTDDICYLSSDRENIIKVKKKIEKELSKIKLNLNVNKLSYGKVEEEFDYLGFNFTKQGIRLSDDSLGYIKKNIILFYKNVRSATKLFNNDYSPTSVEGFNFWKSLSLRINSAIRGYSSLWHDMEFNKEKVYGLARYISIIDDMSQIKIMDKWLRKVNKYYCFKFCEDAQCPKIFVELDSLYNWYFRYKKNHNSAIELAFNRYKSSRVLDYYESDEMPERGNEPLFDEDIENETTYKDANDYKDENDYIIIGGDQYITLEGVYYDPNSENWHPIPDDYNIS